jgi:hypothetical protein
MIKIDFYTNSDIKILNKCLRVRLSYIDCIMIVVQGKVMSGCPEIRRSRGMWCKPILINRGIMRYKAEHGRVIISYFTQQLGKFFR